MVVCGSSEMLSSNTFPLSGSLQPRKVKCLVSSCIQVWDLIWLYHRILNRVQWAQGSFSFGSRGTWGGCTISKWEKAFWIREKAFLQPIRQITLKGKHISPLKPASIQYFPISSKSTVTDVGQNMLPPSEVVISMVRISLILWMSFTLYGGIVFL